MLAILHCYLIILSFKLRIPIDISLELVKDRYVAKSLHLKNR